MPDAITTTDLLLALCMMFGAALYSSVGHAGASSYIALMALFGVPAAVMRPTALVLNIIVATLASARFARAGLFRWRTLWPFLLGALPLALLGGANSRLVTSTARSSASCCSARPRACSGRVS